MQEEVKLDENLLYLSNILFTLDNYKFDSDIIKLLNELKILVDKKMYSNFNLECRDIIKYELIARYYLK